MGAHSTFSKGDVIDHFEIRELIGEGGMGSIYRAVDTRIGRNVVLKVVRADRLSPGRSEEARQRFLRETLAISKVDHRNVVRVLDFGFSGDTPYLAMEYLRGQDLGKLVKASAGFLPVAEVAEVMLGVCAAIRACHDAGIIHRDLKPSNVFLCETDSGRVVKILDFGVSKPAIASDLTRDGEIVGTPQYLAPEQVDGKAVPQTDQYAIGVMLYLCLTGALPYRDHAGFGLLRAIVVGKFDPPRTLRADLPQKLEEIILRAMRIAPEERFESVHALGRELWEFAGPAAREQWRAYYLDDRLRAPPKASTHAMPLIEVMARGLAAGGPIRNAVALAPTATVAPAGVDRATPRAAETATSAAADERPALSPDPSTPTVTSQRNLRDDRRWTRAASIVTVGAVSLAAVAWFALKRPGGAKSPREVAQAAAPAPAPAEAPPPPRQPPERVTAAPPEPAPSPPLPSPVPAQSAATQQQPPKRADRKHSRNKRGAPAEQTADVVQRPSVSVPIMP